MFSNLNHVGFNITQSKLQLVEVVNESSKYCLENVDEHIFEEKFDFDLNESKIIPILQSSLNSLSNRISIKSKNISFSLALKEFQMFEIPFEKSLSKSGLEEHIAWEFSVLFPTLKASDYVIRTLRLVSLEKENRILVVALLKNIVNILSNFSQQNGLNLKSIDTAHFSSDSNIVLLESKKVLSIYLGEELFSINSYLGTELQTSKRFEILGNSFLISSIMDFWENQNIAYNSVYLAGASEMDELKVELEAKINTSVEIINPFQFIDISETFIQNAHYVNSPSSFSSAAGICYRKL